MTRMNLPLRARCPYLVKAADELLAVFVAGNLQNTLNATAWHWQKRRRWAAEWKERTRMALLEHHQRYGVPRDVTTRTPKRLVFTLCVPRAWDDDALPGGVKAVRDALVPYVIHSDGPDSDTSLCTTSGSTGRAAGSRFASGSERRRPRAKRAKARWTTCGRSCRRREGGDDGRLDQR